MAKLTTKERLGHVIESIDEILRYMSNLNEEDFLENTMVQSAVLYQFMVIGEAIKSIDNELLNKYPYPWNVPKSFRNFIAHEYHKIKMTRVYSATEDLIELKSLIETIIETEFPSSI